MKSARWEVAAVLAGAAAAAAALAGTTALAAPATLGSEVGPPSPPPLVLTLEEAVRRAVVASGEVGAASVGIRAAEARLAQARGGSYPRLEATFTAGPSPRARGDQVFSPDDVDRPAVTGVFGRDVRRHIDDIAEKYIRPSEGTLDFALMYIPAENVFYELIARDEGTSEDDDINVYAQKRRVLPVSPNSLYAYVQAIAYGLMGLRIEQRAREILKGLQQLGGDFGIFRDAFDLGLKHLKNAQSAFSDADDRADRLGDKLRQFASVAQANPADEAISSPPVQAEERFQTGRAER